MKVSKKQIPHAVQVEARSAAKTFQSMEPTNDMVPCVFVQQVSARRYDVGWRFTKAGTEVGEVQQDCHPAFNRDQEIAWVWSPCPTCEGEGGLVHYENQSPLGSGMYWPEPIWDPCLDCMEEGCCPKCGSDLDEVTYETCMVCGWEY